MARRVIIYPLLAAKKTKKKPTLWSAVRTRLSANIAAGITGLPPAMLTKLNR
jgi:hypothetical protein